jgi:1,4-dihydroxy-2-naphthoate polyprenyltransferase
MRGARLAVRMLRYRVALMLWLFMLLGAAFEDGLPSFSWGYAWASLALASSYVAATCLNDVADQDSDLGNHPRDQGRPLVTGDATVRDLSTLHRVAAVLTVVAAVPLGWQGLLVVALSLGIAHAYSLPPVRLSFRTYLAPLALAVAYVLVPYALGVFAAGRRATPADAVFAGALFALFVARINLKDFRDRAGDALFGKPTFLLRFGKPATCTVSLVALVVGDLLLLAAVRPSPAVGILLELFVAAVGWMLLVLWRSEFPGAEQVAIGIGARMGNGLLVVVLAWLVLTGAGATAPEAFGLSAALAALFGVGFVALVRRPGEAVIGYKG